MNFDSLKPPILQLSTDESFDEATRLLEKMIFGISKAEFIPKKFYRSINDMRGANLGNVWEFSHVHYCNKNRKQHPTQKPEGLYERMILASSNENDIILDPFAGSGTALRVCQQTQRNCIGIEINPDYIETINSRLRDPFSGFDSIDARMKRVPSDLTDPTIRAEYIENHKRWFLKTHPDAEAALMSEVNKQSPNKPLQVQ